MVQLEGPDPFEDVEVEMYLAGVISSVMGTSAEVEKTSGHRSIFHAYRPNDRP